MASNLSVGSSVVVNRPSTGSPDPRQLPFGSGHQARYPAGYAGRSAEGPTIMSRFPVAFRPPAFASRVILHPPRNSISLTVDLPDPVAWPSTGLSRSARTRFDRIGRPLPPRDSGALLASSTPWPAPAASQRPVLLTPLLHPIRGVRR